jgi:hypothetical protein
MLKVLKAEAPTLIWLRRAALHVGGGAPDTLPVAQTTSNTVAGDVPDVDVFKILKTPRSSLSNPTGTGDLADLDAVGFGQPGRAR